MPELTSAPPTEPLPPPFPLAEGEVVVSTGGPSWVVWVFGAALAPLLCVLVPVALLPWVVSGRFWLTQRRLIWKSRWGKPKELAIAQITQVKIVGSRQTVSVKSEQGGLTVRLSTNWRELWGALLLFRQVPLPERVGPPRASFTGQRTLCVEGGNRQEGYLVFHRDRAFFLPNQPRHHLAADVAKLGARAALALVGATVVTYQAELPFELWLSLWRHLPDEELAALLERTTQSRGGVMARMGELVPVLGKQAYTYGAFEFRVMPALPRWMRSF